MSFSPLIDQLIESLCCLPGVGPKSAQRMALYLLEQDRCRGERLANSLTLAMEKVGRCRQCRTFCELEQCHICTNPHRNHYQLCVVETPADVLAVEHTGGFSGRYFVLMGHLSPIDGIGPEDIGIDILLQQVTNSDINEIIIATNPTVEGEVTAHFIAEQIQPRDIKVTRIAHGVPLGGELEFVDGGTLAHAFAGRRSVL